VQRFHHPSPTLEVHQRFESIIIFSSVKDSQIRFFYIYPVKAYHKLTHIIIAVHRHISYETQEGTLRERTSPHRIISNTADQNVPLQRRLSSSLFSSSSISLLVGADEQ
jgi:hypothetical protein